MPDYTTEDIRNVALVGHAGGGKTNLVEALLQHAGTIGDMGEISRGTTLLPGTVILTGTPSGVGMARTPPRYLVDGDVVEVELGGIGVLSNRVSTEGVT